MPILNPFTPSSDIPFGGDVSSSSVNNPDNNIETWIQGNVKTAPVISPTGSVATLNSTNLYVFSQPPIGGQTIALPTISGYVEYTIFKDNTNKGIITINPSGGNTINGNSSYAIYTEESSVTLIGEGTNWRIVTEVFNTRKLHARAYQSVAQNINAPFPGTKITMTSETHDYNSDFDTGLSRWVCSVPGWYDFKGQVMYIPGSTTQTEVYIFKNGAHFTSGISQNSGNIAKLSYAAAIPMSIGDYIEIFSMTSSVSRTTNASSQDTFFTADFTGPL